MEMLIQRHYKDIKPERILDISDLKIIPLGTDEVFVKLMDYKNSWLSNYGRVIRSSNGKYSLLQGSYDSYGALFYSNQEQYRIVKNHFSETGDDSEGFILKAMNDIRYKPDDWSRRCMDPIMCGIGYRGSENVDCTSESYLKWHDVFQLIDDPFRYHLIY